MPPAFYAIFENDMHCLPVEEGYLTIRTHRQWEAPNSARNPIFIELLALQEWCILLLKVTAAGARPSEKAAGGGDADQDGDDDDKYYAPRLPIWIQS